MISYSHETVTRRRKNARAVQAFGVRVDKQDDGLYREIRSGNGTTIFTVGYERRDTEDLLSRLRDAGVDILVDIRERPISRRAEFRSGALEASCNEAGLVYKSWKELGSTSHQREQLRSTGDLSKFRHRFRDFARRSRANEINKLANFSKKNTIALFCYERLHEECHRSIVADLVAEKINATVVAIT